MQFHPPEQPSSSLLVRIAAATHTRLLQNLQRQAACETKVYGQAGLLTAGATQPHTSVGEPGIGIVGPEGHAELHAAGEHPVRLAGAQRGKVVDQDANVAFGATHNERGLAVNPQASIDPSNHTLGREKTKQKTFIGLFVAKVSAHLPPKPPVSNQTLANAIVCASNGGSFFFVIRRLSAGLLSLR